MEGRIRQLEHILENAEIIEGAGDGMRRRRARSSRIVYEGDCDDDAERYLVGHIEEKTGDLDVVSPTARRSAPP